MNPRTALPHPALLVGLLLTTALLGCNFDFDQQPLGSCEDCDTRGTDVDGDTSTTVDVADTTDTGEDTDVVEPCEGACAEACCAPELGVAGCVDLTSDAQNCGGCGVVCHPTQTCFGAQCQCPEGFGDCDGRSENGCESDITTPTHCGGCGNTCGTGETCFSDGICGCGETRADITGVPACGNNGQCCAGLCQSEPCPCGAGDLTCSAPTRCCNNSLCTDISGDTQNCGGCNIACAEGASCSDGLCQCPDEQVYCGDDAGCVATRQATSCGTTCERVTDCTRAELNFEGVSTCQGGECSGLCALPYLDCDGDSHTGCEAQADTETRCGACDRACVADGVDLHGTFDGCLIEGTWGGPDAGRCAYTCEGDYADCDLDQPGCETLLSDTTSCGVCGRDCTALQGISDASCEPTPDSDIPYQCAGTCALGFDDCDGDIQNGCEDLSADNTNCGFCGNACPDDERCTASGCACPEGLTRCNGNCVNTSTSRQHCGACGNRCSSLQTCRRGTCVTT